MTNDYTDKARALFLAALMVFSVFAGSVAFAGTAAADANDLTLDETSVSSGDDVSGTVNSTNASGEEITIWIDAEDDGFDADDPSTTVNADENDTSFSGLSTDGLATGEYNVYATNDTSGTADQVGPVTLNVETESSTESDDTLANETFWQGQLLFANGFNDSETLEIRTDDDAEDLETQVTADSNGEVLIDTSDLDGSYFLEDSDNNVVYEFEIAQQSLTAETADDEAANAGEDIETTLNLDSNRGDYDAYITGELDGESLDNETLEEIFDEDASNVADDESTVMVSGGSSSSLNANFSGQDAGNYTFTVEVTDTTASDDTSIDVRDVGEGEAQFNESSVEVAQGGVAEITVEFSEAVDSGTLVIGNEESDNYQLDVELVDGSDDGEVTVQFNTYAAGNDSYTTVTAADEDDTVNATDEVSLSSILDTGDYEIAVSTADNADDTIDTPDDVGSVYVAERSTDSSTLWTAPAGTDLGSSADDVTGLVEDGVLTEDDTIATDGEGTTDWLVIQVDATGIDGLFDAHEDFSDAVDSGAVDLTVEQTNPGNNADPSELNVSESSDAITFVEGEDTYYLAIDTEEASWTEDGVEVGNNYNATFAVTDDRLFDDEEASESASSEYEYVEGAHTLDDDPVNVTASADQAITGTSTWAPGTEFTVRVRNDDDTQPRFFKSDTVTVQSDGTWNGTFDFSEQSTGDGFTVSTNDATGFEDTEGNVVESVSDGTPGTDDGTPTTDDGTPTDTATPDDGTPTDTATPDEGDGNGDDSTPTETTTPGFTAVLALIALIGAALVAVRRD